jgi:hypothetical protein
MVGDPVGVGFVASVPRPGGNLTGFMLREPSLASKWLQLLAEIAPGVTRVPIMTGGAGGGSLYLLAFETAARSLKVRVARYHGRCSNARGCGRLGLWRARAARHHPKRKRLLGWRFWWAWVAPCGPGATVAAELPQ